MGRAADASGIDRQISERSGRCARRGAFSRNRRRAVGHEVRGHAEDVVRDEQLVGSALADRKRRVLVEAPSGDGVGDRSDFAIEGDGDKQAFELGRECNGCGVRRGWET